MTHAEGKAVKSIGMLLVLIFGISLLATPPADAARKPTKIELKSIRKAAMTYCKRTQKADGHSCKWLGGTRVSTVNRRYAWASVFGPFYDSSGILRRKHKRSKKWKVLRVVGGQANFCSHWYAVAPRKVVRDFRIKGYDRIPDMSDWTRC